MAQACDSSCYSKRALHVPLGRKASASLHKMQDASWALAYMQGSNRGLTLADVVHTQLPSMG